MYDSLYTNLKSYAKTYYKKLLAPKKIISDLEKGSLLSLEE
jgi:hypothetical protein